MTYDDIVLSVTFSPDRKYVVSGGKDRMVRVWEYIPKNLIANACLHVPRNLTRAEWNTILGDGLPYQAVCPDLPIEGKP